MTVSFTPVRHAVAYRGEQLQIKIIISDNSILFEHNGFFL